MTKLHAPVKIKQWLNILFILQLDTIHVLYDISSYITDTHDCVLHLRLLRHKGGAHTYLCVVPQDIAMRVSSCIVPRGIYRDTPMPGCVCRSAVGTMRSH